MAKVAMRVEASAAGVPAHGGAAALVAGVEQAAEVFVGVAGFGSEDGVGFVDQQGGRVGRVRADRPVDRRRGGVGGEDRLMRQGFDEVEQPGLAAALLRGLDDQPGGGVPGRHGVGGGDPQHDRGGGVVVGEDDVGADRGFDLVQQLGAVDQVGDGRRRGWSCDAPSGSGAGFEDAAGEAGADGGVGLAGGEGAGLDVVGDGSAELVADGVGVDQAAADELPESDGGGEQGLVAGPGGCHPDPGGLAGQRGRRVAGRQRNPRPAGGCLRSRVAGWVPAGGCGAGC